MRANTLQITALQGAKEEGNGQRGREPGRANIEWHMAQLVTGWDLRDVRREAAAIARVLWCWWWSCGRDRDEEGEGGHFLPPPCPQSRPSGSPGNRAEPGPAVMTWAHHNVIIPLGPRGHARKAAMKHNKTYFSGDGAVSSEIFKEAAGERVLSRERTQLERSQGV